MSRLKRFLKLFLRLRVFKVMLPTFHVTYGDDVTVKNIWKHSSMWRD